MATPPPVPRTLDAWLKQLTHVLLPVPAESHERVRLALGDSHRSIREIAELIQDSPALALCVLREANQQGGQAEPAESLETALNRLGVKRTEQLLMRLPAKAREDIPEGLRQLQLISLHAAFQANGLFASRLARLWQEIHWGSLLFLAPLWPLALLHPKRLDDWELRVVHKHEPARAVELELFGVPLVALALALARQWRLPAWIIQGYETLISERHLLAKAMLIASGFQNPLTQQQRLDADLPLQRWLNQPANSVLIANGVALGAHEAWAAHRSQRWQQLAALFLQTSLENVHQQVHQQAVQSARQDAGGHLWHPAESLIWPWQARRPHPGLLAAATPDVDALDQWRKRCRELLGDPSPFTNTLHLTTYAKDTLLACGLTRVMLLMSDRAQANLRVQQSAGLPDSASGLHLLVGNSSILKRLLAQPTPLRLTPANHAQFAALLPANVVGLFNGQHALLRSVASNGRVVMLLIADQGGGPLSETCVQAFGKTAQCIERALTNFSNRKA